MSNFMGQCKLRDLGWHPTIVVDKCNDACVKGTLCTLILTSNCFGVGFVFLTNATGSAGGTCNPGQTQCAAREIPTNALFN